MQIFHILRRLMPGRALATITVSLLVGVLAMLNPAPAQAVIGAADNVPAATLLLPYFEVDLNNPNGVQTSMRVSNASASAGMLNVTLWTDWGLPTKSFSIYLTGYDTTEIDLRLVFKGHLPRTADAGADPTNKISPKGLYSQDINFPGSGGPAATPYTTLLTPAAVQNMRNAHTGVASTTFGGLCGGQAYGDSIARGYVTIDTVVQGLDVDEANPSTAGYFVNYAADRRNIYVGSYTVINRALHYVTTDAMVHIEASSTNPLVITPGNPTFYSRFNGTPNNHIDNREPLSSVWDTRYLNGGAFTGGTRIKVWRDPVVNPTPVACGGMPTGMPFGMREIVALDEQETIAFSPTAGVPAAGSINSFPVVAQSVLAAPLSPFQFGVLRLNFNDAGTAAPFNGARQAHVSAYHVATGSYAVSVPGVVIARQDGVGDNPTANRIGN